MVMLHHPVDLYHVFFRFCPWGQNGPPWGHMFNIGFMVLLKVPHNLIKDKLIDLIERTFNRKGSHYISYNDINAFCTLENPENIMHGLVKMYVIC